MSLMNVVYEGTSVSDSPQELGAALKRVAELENELRRLRAEFGSVPAPTMHQMRLFDVEALLVKQAMERAQGNVSRAARALGLSRSALYRRLDRHKLEVRN